MARSKEPKYTERNLVLEPSGSKEAVAEVGLAFPRLFLNTVLPKILPRFREMFPGVRLRIDERSASAAKAVLSGRIDVALYAGTDRDPRLTYQLLPTIPMLVASPRIYTWNAERISARAFARQPLIVYPKGTPLRGIMDKWLKKSRVKAENLVMTARDTETILKFVSLGLGHALVPSLGLKASREYRLHQVSATVGKYSPVMVYRSDDNGLSEPAVAIVNMIEDVLPAFIRVWPVDSG